MIDSISEKSIEITEMSPYDITVDHTILPRVKASEQIIYEYAQALENGGELPPIDVFFDGSIYLLADGYHRLEAHILEKRDTIPVKVHPGDKKAALLHSLGSNANHGLRRTNADKEKAVTIALKDPDIQVYSDNQIAKICKVSQPFVGNIRKKLTYNGYKFESTRLCADGKLMNVSGISGRKDKKLTGTERNEESGNDVEINTDVDATSQEGQGGEVIPHNLEDENQHLNQDGTEEGENSLDTGDPDETDSPGDDVEDNSEIEGEPNTDVTVTSGNDSEINLQTELPPDAEQSEEGANPVPEDENQPANQEDPEEEESDPDAGSSDETDTSNDEVGNEPEADAVPTNANEAEIDTDNNSPQGNDLDGIDDVDTLKSMIIELRAVNAEQEKEIELKDNQISSLEKQVDELEGHVQYLQAELHSHSVLSGKSSISLNMESLESELCSLV